MIKSRNVSGYNAVFTAHGTESFLDLLQNNPSYLPSAPGSDRRTLPPRQDDFKAENNKVLLIGSHDHTNPQVAEGQMGQTIRFHGQPAPVQWPGFLHVNSQVHPGEQALWTDYSDRDVLPYVKFGANPTRETWFAPPSFENSRNDLPHYDSVAN